MREIKIPKGRVHYFGNYGEFLVECLKPSPLTDDQRSSQTKSTEWYGGSWEEAKFIGLSGDVKTAGLLRQSMIKEANKIMGMVQRLDPVYREDGGAWIDVSRYLSGEPEVWGDMVDMGAQRKARRVAIVFNAGANSFVSSTTYERVAVAIGGAVLGIKAMGISTSLYVCFKNRGWDSLGGMDEDIAAVNMTPGNGFDVARLSATTRAMFFRRLVFAYWEAREESFRKAHSIYKDGGYGRCEEINLQEAKAISGIENPLVLNICNMTSLTNEEIRERIISTIHEKEKQKI